jgi:hypothetical protein
MKPQILSVCLLLSLLGAGRAWSDPSPLPSEAAVPSVPQPSRGTLEARRQALEARRKAMEDELRQLAVDTDAQARQLDPDRRLTSDQLYALLQAREDRRMAERFDPTPVAVCTTVFGSLLLGFLAWLWSGDRKARRLHETVRLMVEKGAEIPQGLLTPPPRHKPSELRRGIILSSTGLGLTLVLALLPDLHGAWSAGLSLLLIGLGHVLVWRLQRAGGALASALSPEWPS